MAVAYFVAPSASLPPPSPPTPPTRGWRGRLWLFYTLISFLQMYSHSSPIFLYRHRGKWWKCLL